MKYSFLSTFSLFALCLNSISCGATKLELICRTRNSKNAAIFKNDTELMLERYADISQCYSNYEKRNFDGLYHLNYSRCIFSLNLPESYEKHFSFSNRRIPKLDFQEVVKNSAMGVCRELRGVFSFTLKNLGHDHYDDKPRISAIIYKIDDISSTKITEVNAENVNISSAGANFENTDNSNSPFIYTTIIFGVLLLCLMIAFSIHFIRKNKEKSSGESVAGSEFVNDSIVAAGSNDNLPAYEPLSYSDAKY